MGQILSFPPRLAGDRPSAARACPRCGAELWTIYADGRVLCGDCEAPFPLRPGSAEVPPPGPIADFSGGRGPDS